MHPSTRMRRSRDRWRNKAIRRGAAGCKSRKEIKRLKTRLEQKEKEVQQRIQKEKSLSFRDSRSVRWFSLNARFWLFLLSLSSLLIPVPA